jgi:geranylgeranylglycerol-phosphate geranylgeranyltransferase
MQHLKRVTTALSTTRPRRSFMLFLAVAFGFLLAGRSWGGALVAASPMLAISLAGFCINDIFDQEMDRINHPDRALASYPALSNLVMSLYVILFVISIGLIFLQERSIDRFTWAIAFILLSNYSVFKRDLPPLKNAYVAVTACVICSILDVGGDHSLPLVARYGPLFLAVFAREFALDIPDARGDKGTLVQTLHPTASLYLAMALYAAALSFALYFSIKPIQLTMSLIGIILFFGYLFARLRLGWQEEALRSVSGVFAGLPAILVIT